MGAGIDRYLKAARTRTARPAKTLQDGTVVLATMSLYIFGGGPINDFAFTFLVGIITGTYSSIYIATALVLWWHKGQRPNIGNAPVPAENIAPEKVGA